jgi:DNA-binding NtrC family response regulator
MNNRTSILIVDDEMVVRDSLTKWFLEDGYRVGAAENAADAIRQMQVRTWDIILLDIKMPGMDGMELQQHIKEIDPSATIIFITAHASVDTAVQALKSGAFDYITKPIDPDYLSHLVANAVRHRALVSENIRLKAQVATFPGLDEVVGESPAMQQVFQLVETVARTDTAVMIRGENGTGKELLARAIHGNSQRRYFPMVIVNCGEMPEGSIEGELFGQERGAPGGAQYRPKGKLELADQGTLFLDEVVKLDMKTQMDLLRVIETGQFNRAGSNETIQTDFRILCATGMDLERAVQEGAFREDLYYRLNVFAIYIPPLRERKSDVPLLAEYFVGKYSRSRPIPAISPETMDVLVRHDWPGNVRELENAIERAVLVGKLPAIMPDDLPFRITEKNHIPRSGSLVSMERAHIAEALAQHSWNITRSAEVLEIDRVTLYKKIRRYGLRKP